MLVQGEERPGHRHFVLSCDRPNLGSQPWTGRNSLYIGQRGPAYVAGVAREPALVGAELRGGAWPSELHRNPTQPWEVTQRLPGTTVSFILA